MGNALTLTGRTAIVDSVDAEKATVKVKFPDLPTPDGKPLVSNDMQVVRFRAFGDREYWMPDIDEQVFCFFLGTGIEHGFVLGGIYSTEDPPPVTDANKRHIVYKDETFWEYDRKEHKLTIRISGKQLDEKEGGDGKAARNGGGGERGGKVEIFIEETTDIHGKGNITVKCDADILVQAEGKIDVIAKKDVTVKTEANVIVEAKGDIKGTADGNIDLKAKKIKLEADDGIELKAGGAIDIKAGGEITQKGSQIKLN